MIILNEIFIGNYPAYNGMGMFRIYDSAKGFAPRFKILFGENNDQYLDLDNNIIIPYLEYFKNADGLVVNELTRYKHYKIENLPQLIYEAGEIMQNGEIAEGGEIKRPQLNLANDWFTLLSRTPQNEAQQATFLQNFTGIIDAIEYTLASFPLDIPNGYILQGGL